MNIAAQHGYEARPESRTTAQVIGSGSVVEGLVGAGALALAILGLVGILPLWMAAIGTIAAGAAFLIEGIAISSRMADLMEADKSGRFDVSEIGGGVSAEYLAGLAGIALGVLALLGISPLPLMAAAVIAFGGALIMGSGTTSRLNSFAAAEVNPATKAMAREALSAASSLQIVAGVGAVVLGIFALVDQPNLTFVLVGLVVTGAAGFVGGTTLGGKLLTTFRK